MRARRLGLGVVVVVAVVGCRRREPAAGADGAPPLVTASQPAAVDPAGLRVVSGPPGLAAFPGAEGFGAEATGGGPAGIGSPGVSGEGGTAGM